MARPRIIELHKIRLMNSCYRHHHGGVSVPNGQRADAESVPVLICTAEQAQPQWVPRMVHEDLADAERHVRQEP